MRLENIEKVTLLTITITKAEFNQIYDMVTREIAVIDDYGDVNNREDDLQRLLQKMIKIESQLLNQ